MHKIIKFVKGQPKKLTRLVTKVVTNHWFLAATSIVFVWSCLFNMSKDCVLLAAVLTLLIQALFKSFEKKIEKLSKIAEDVANRELKLKETVKALDTIKLLRDAWQAGRESFDTEEECPTFINRYNEEKNLW